MSDMGVVDCAAAGTVSGPTSDKRARPSWRDHLKVHPAADLFPLMSEAELRELGADVKKNRQRYPVVLWQENEGAPVYLLDGRNRLDARELVGLPVFDPKDYRGFPVHWSFRRGNPYDLVLSLNLHRRHLTSEQKRDLIAKVLKAKPEQSNRKIAKQVKAHHTTVGTVRVEMESTGEISQLDKTTGADGKKRKKPAKKRTVETDAERAAASAEISADERREYYAATENPPTVDDKNVEILPPIPNDGNPIWIAWCKAKPKQRREFVTLGWDDIERERKRPMKLGDGQP